MKLYEISEQIERVILDGTDRETGEIGDEALAALDELEATLEDKALNVGCFIKGEIAEAEAVEREAKKLKARADIHKRRAERLKRYLASHIEGQKYRDARCEIWWRKSTAVEVEDGAELPIKFIREKVIREPDKVEIGKALKAGESVSGAHLVERHTLQVK